MLRQKNIILWTVVSLVCLTCSVYRSLKNICFDCRILFLQHRTIWTHLSVCWLNCPGDKTDNNGCTHFFAKISQGKSARPNEISSPSLSFSLISLRCVACSSFFVPPEDQTKVIKQKSDRNSTLKRISFARHFLCFHSRMIKELISSQKLNGKKIVKTFSVGDRIKKNPIDFECLKVASSCLRPQKFILFS